MTEIEKKDVKMWFLTNKIRWEMFPMNIEKIIIEVGKNDDMLEMNFFPLKNCIIFHEFELYEN